MNTGTTGTTTSTELTPADTAYAHLCSFQAGDRVAVMGADWYHAGTITTPLSTPIPDEEDSRPFTGPRTEGTLDLPLTVATSNGEVTVTTRDLLEGEVNITTREKANAGIWDEFAGPLPEEA
jgi:hypothetical protein